MLRRGLSLIELLVTMALMAVLLGLSLSAVQRARTAADRLSCSARLKQVALAAELYHDSHSRLPPGCSDFQDVLHDISWLTRLLPYLDQIGLWETVAPAFAANPFPSRAPVHPGLSQPMPVFSCPSDVRTRVAWRLPEFPPATIAMTSFLGNLGGSVVDPSGVFYRNSRTQHVQIVDGSSNTLLAGERPPSPDLNFGWWYYGIGQGGGSLDYLLGSQEVNRSERGFYRVCGEPHGFRPGQLENYCSTFHYWSLHPNGANFAFCDGSVRFLNYAARTVLPALATRAGGESVEVP